MYLSENNIYLPIPRNYSLDDLKGLLSDTLDISFFNHAQDGTDTLLVLAYIAQYITSEELSAIFGKEMGNKRVKQCINRLVLRKLLKSEKFTRPDGHSKSAYCLTKRGIETVSTLLPSSILQPVKVRRSGGYVPGHDYGCGMSLLSILSMGKAFNYRREYTIGGIYKKKHSLCIDALVNIGKDILYVEQDMGTEAIRTLLNKIAAYNEQGLTGSGGGRLVFSCRRAEVPVSDDCFSLTYLEEIKKYARDGVISALPSLSLKGRACADSLLSVMGVYDQKGARIGHRDVTYEELMRFMDELEGGHNLYRLMVKGKVQVQAAFSTYLSLLRALLPQISHTERYEVAALLGGFSCCVYPTDLLSSYLSDPPLLSYLTEYRPEINTEMEGLRRGSCIFPVYRCEDRFIACGDLSHDLTFMVRYLYVKSSFENLSLFGCVDSHEQAKRLYSIIPEAVYVLRSGSRPFVVEKGKSGTLRCVPVKEGAFLSDGTI